MELIGDVGHVESHFFSVWRVLVSVQDWCMVCARRTIGSEIILDAPDRTLGDEAQVKGRSFGDSANLDAR